MPYLKKLTKVPNTTCPVKGKEKIAKKGKAVIAFCCTKCKGAFEKAPQKFLGKLVAKKKKKKSE